VQQQVLAVAAGLRSRSCWQGPATARAEQHTCTAIVGCGAPAAKPQCVVRSWPATLLEVAADEMGCGICTHIALCAHCITSGAPSSSAFVIVCGLGGPEWPLAENVVQSPLTSKPRL
jgi:hypothetical protein